MLGGFWWSGEVNMINTYIEFWSFSLLLKPFPLNSSYLDLSLSLPPPFDPLVLISVVFMSMSWGYLLEHEQLISIYITGEKWDPLSQYPLTLHCPSVRSSPFPRHGEILRNLVLPSSYIDNQSCSGFMALPHPGSAVSKILPPNYWPFHSFEPLLLDVPWALEGMALMSYL